jgi:glycosyltransferase involved in cell wall biosynthesis
MTQPLRVLFFIDRLRLGGIQMLAYDILRNNDPSKMDIEILNLDDGQEYPLTKTLKGMGVTIHQLKGAWMRTPLDLPHYFKSVDNFFEQHHDYDVVHMHSSSKNYYILKCAAKWNIPVRVAHSHNTGFQSRNPLVVTYGNLLKRPMRRYATHWVGCSKLACEWLFGKGCVENGKARVILNGIDSTLFVYNEKERHELRQELGFDDKFVIGHVGRFVNQKNHTFLLDVFAEVCKRRDNAVLMLIGIGELMDAMKQKAVNLGIADKVRFVGFRNDRNRFMQAMDSFLFPSLYEGLSVVLIEAQAAGLPVFASDSTTTETQFSPYMKFLSLQQSATLWADEILKVGCVERKDMTESLEKAGFDIRSMVHNLYKLYTEKNK